MADFGYQIQNISSGEVSLPAPVNKTVAAGKSTTIIVTDPASIEDNATLKQFVRNRVIVIYSVPVQSAPPASNAPNQTVYYVQGPAGPQGPAGFGSEVGTFASVGTVLALDLVYISGPNQVSRANASSTAKMPCIGFVQSKPNASTAIVQYRGELEGFLGLTPDALYYANTSDGTITLVAPSTNGQVLQRVGQAKNSTTLIIDIDEMIVL